MNVSRNISKTLTSAQQFMSRRLSQNRATATVSDEDRQKLVSSILNTSLSSGLCDENENSLSLLDTLYTVKSIRTPYVTKILEDTKPVKDKIILQRWKAKMIREMGKDGFQKHMNEIIQTGTSFHAAVEEYFKKRNICEVTVSPSVINYWKSVQPHLGNVGKVLMAEEKVTHPSLMYGGRVDCVAIYKDVLCVIDWKTSRKPKRSLKDCFDEPFQIAAYVGAINAMNVLPNKVTCGVIVKAYEDGTVADALQINKKSLEYLWYRFLQRLADFHSQNLQLDT